MGLFFNTCTNSQCGRWVPKAARFCRYCGSPNDGGKVLCWRCRTELATSSQFCYKCGEDQSEQRDVSLINRKWVRGEDDLALRVEDVELGGFLNKGMIIDHGVEAAIFQRGRLVGVVGPGEYTVDGLFKRLTTLNHGLPASLLVYDAGDVELVIDTGDLRSADGLEVSATYKVVVRVKDADSFAANLFKGRRVLRRSTLASMLSDGLRQALKETVVTRKVDELFRSEGIRGAIEESLREAAGQMLWRQGVEIVQLVLVDFFSPKYEGVLKEEGDLAVAIKKGAVDTERLKLTQRLRKVMTQDKMDAFASENELEDFIRQQEHEVGLKNVIREDEMARLKSCFAQAREKEALVRRLEIEAIHDEALRRQAEESLIAEENRKDLSHERDLKRQLSKAKTDAEKAEIEDKIERLKMKREMDEAEAAVELRRKSQSAEREHERELLEQRGKATVEALMTIVDAPAADRLARLREFEKKSGLSPEQLFAIAASDNPEVAKAYAQEKGIKNYEEMLKKQEGVHKEYADRMERMMQTALEQMGRVATGKASAPGMQAVFPGTGKPVVMGGGEPCRKCGQPLLPGAEFCSNCGKKVG